MTYLVVALLAAAPAAEAPVDPDLARKAQAIFKANCHRCHGQDGANEGGFNYVLDRSRLVARKKVVAGNPAGSRLFRRLIDKDDPMPPADEKPRPSEDDVALLRQWIEAGAPDFGAAPAPRKFLSLADVLRVVRADLEALPERQRRFARYFTLHHLRSAGLSEDELQSHRHGLSKLVNSLSWGGKVVAPAAVDPGRTLFRIDLRDYQWDAGVWERILDANPYGVVPDSADARACAVAAGCATPLVRADWFVAAASRPPLYHEVLQLPDTEQELQRLLRVDVAANIRAERLARAGFNGSGVSRNNRMIERHESNGVVYWRSYDFGGNAGRQNLFAHPLSAGESARPFEHDGGEIIFSLPNGLQGYYLCDARGRRLDRGPTAIVSDPRRPDRAVVNGLSCMGCHARGLIDKADQVREHVAKNGDAFDRADAELVQTLYPPRERLSELIRKDAERFRAAVARTGAPLSATEPVEALALRFEAELDLALAAAEAGVTPAGLLRALERSPVLAGQLGPLKVEGGTVQRDAFVDAFADLVRELRLGTHLESRRALHERLLRRAAVLRRQGDPVGAETACTAALEAVPDSARAYHQRALARHDRKELPKALDDYHHAIRLDPSDAVVHHNRGSAHYDRQDFDRAVADFTQAIRLDPRYASAFNNRGLAHHRKGDPDRALDDFAQALRLDPGLASAHHNQGGVHLARGAFGAAVAAYTEAIRLDPNRAVTFNNRGLALHKSGDHQAAVADFGRALALDPRFVAAHHNRGLARHALGEYRRAVADFTEAIRLDPRFARAYYHRAESHAKNGAGALAAQDRARAVELDPDLDD